MERREFMAFLGGAAAVLPLTASAQQPAPPSPAPGSPVREDWLDLRRQRHRKGRPLRRNGRTLLSDQRDRLIAAVGRPVGRAIEPSRDKAPRRMSRGHSSEAQMTTHRQFEQIEEGVSRRGLVQALAAGAAVSGFATPSYA